jgi:putative DNA primase/helicase
LHVGRLLATRYPSSPLIVAGDDDRETEANGKGNPGREAARQVAAKLGCGMILPEWPSNAPITLTDFNDLHRWLEHV